MGYTTKPGGFPAEISFVKTRISFKVRAMLKGVFVGVGIMIVCLLIPIAHFVLGPAGPFIGGYFGISYGAGGNGHSATRALKFGVAFGLFWLAIAGTAGAVLTLVFSLSPRILIFLWVGVAILTLYTGSMSALGAMYSSLRTQQRAVPASSSE